MLKCTSIRALLMFTVFLNWVKVRADEPSLPCAISQGEPLMLCDRRTEYCDSTLDKCQNCAYPCRKYILIGADEDRKSECFTQCSQYLINLYVESLRTPIITHPATTTAIDLPAAVIYDSQVTNKTNMSDHIEAILWVILVCNILWTTVVCMVAILCFINRKPLLCQLRHWNKVEDIEPGVRPAGQQNRELGEKEPLVPPSPDQTARRPGDHPHPGGLHFDDQQPHGETPGNHNILPGPCDSSQQGDNGLSSSRQGNVSAASSIAAGCIDLSQAGGPVDSASSDSSASRGYCTELSNSSPMDHCSTPQQPTDTKMGKPTFAHQDTGTDVKFVEENTPATCI